jgi:hypothetical protein
MNQPCALSPFGLSGRDPRRKIGRINAYGRPSRISLACFCLFEDGQKFVGDAFLDDIRVEFPQFTTDRILTPTRDARVQTRLSGVISPVVAAPVSFSSHIRFNFFWPCTGRTSGSKRGQCM